jgi:Undecaprenyl-phosphate glucose phosphotransferase
VLFAGLVLAGALLWLGWPVPVLLQTSCLWMVAVTMALIAASQLCAYTLSRPFIKERLTRKIAIIGYDAHAFRIAERFAASSFYGVSVQGVFADVPAQPDRMATNGSLGDLIRLSQEKSGLDAVIIALPPAHGHENEIASLTWRLRGVAADVYVMPYLIHGPDSILPIQSIGAMSFMVLQRRPLDERQAIYKRIFDIVVSLIALIIFLPILAIAAAAIMLDSRGPVVFRQPRCGFNNHQFLVYKFRTMYTETSDGRSFKQTSRNDPRVTRVGKWLRKFSVDELPQLLNVLHGEMSLVGPRPHAPQTRVDGELLDDVIVEYVMRYRVKPGITGWAQVNGARGELVKREDLRRRVAFDLEYIQRWSIIFDLKIIILTAVREIFSKNAF